MPEKSLTPRNNHYINRKARALAQEVSKRVENGLRDNIWLNDFERAEAIIEFRREKVLEDWKRHSTYCQREIIYYILEIYIGWDFFYGVKNYLDEHLKCGCDDEENPFVAFIEFKYKTIDAITEAADDWEPVNFDHFESFTDARSINYFGHNY